MKDLNKRLSYDPETDVVTWTQRRVRKDLIGKEAGYIRLGRRWMRIGWMSYPTTHVIWRLVYGRWPAEGMEIDHIDGSSLNDRFCNLQEITHSDNIYRWHRGRTSGVCKNNSNGKWLAQYMPAPGKRLRKHFPTEAEALTQRKAWEKQFPRKCL